MPGYGYGYGIKNVVTSALKALVNAFRARVFADGGTFEGEANLLNQNLANINDASFVYVPSSWKPSKLYALKPTNGSGDLVFSRASLVYRNNASNVLEQMASNIGRIHWINGVPTLLIDPVRTNLFVRSEDLPNWIGLNQFCLTASNVADAPNNTTTADKLIADNSTNQHRVGQFVSVAAATYTVSVFAKAAEYGYLSLGQGGGIAGGDVIFNLINGTIGGTNTSSVNPVIAAVGNGWYRCSVTVTVSAGNSFFWMVVRDSNSSASYTGDNSKGIIIWGAQIELGAFATSYIPTTASTVTRVGDAVFNSNATSFIGQDAGTILVNYRPYAFGLSTGRIVVSTDDTLNDRIWLAYNTNNTITCFIRNTSGVIYIANSTALQVNGLNKIAIAYANGDIRIYLNGVLVLSSSAALVFAQPRNNLYIGSAEISNNLNQIYIDSCSAYMTALPNSECINITT